ncbi:MAG TPA: response regulator [Methanomassiliicoccales archaeon]|jgi:CheY-like chemotaxis protein
MMVKVLIVEDNPADLRIAEEMLKETGHVVEILSASDGEKAIAIICELAKGGPGSKNLILLDLKIPKVDGIEVLRKIREIKGNSRTMVAVLTGSLMPEDRVRALELKADAFLTKPMSMDEFESVTDEIKGLLASLAHPSTQ